ncbi:hypothetical protein H7J06_18140 [Mycobacterium hodleri]|uniref:hypothetical protein n=1 Tax=Mycolicibacterium hodleri TaxID=49897 RepID=UPI0021F3AF0D|nr:hypothetical protein [Mycolicibacterium hodleri]MCV7134906.1 hypothetical protein [Mycolicibacterium hodleri]
MSEAGVWVAWGIPARGREGQALALLKSSLTGYLEQLSTEGRIERYDAAVLKPQSTELGGFILIQGTHDQIDALRTDQGFQTWVTQIQLVADKVGIVDAWVGGGLAEAFALYEKALEKLG